MVFGANFVVYFRPQGFAQGGVEISGPLNTGGLQDPESARGLRGSLQKVADATEEDTIVSLHCGQNPGKSHPMGLSNCSKSQGPRPL